jgi:hypothetical protein
MKEIVTKILSDEFMRSKIATFFDNESNDSKFRIFNEDVDVYIKDSDSKLKLLLKFRKNMISKEDTNILYNNMRKAAKLNSGRPNASGLSEDGKKYKYIESKSTGKLLHVLTTQAHSGIAGFYDSKSNFGSYHNKSDEFCRKTAFTGKYWDNFQECLPIFKKIDRIYKKLIPKYYTLQKEAISLIDPEYVIKDTIFTTITVNKNFRTALHQDSGDFKDGFGNLIVCYPENTEYTGGYTLFPQYGIGVDCRNGDFLAMDVHEYHCNSEMIFKNKSERISFVFYLREKMLKNCLKK